jgi:hypothetical protein
VVLNPLNLKNQNPTHANGCGNEPTRKRHRKITSKGITVFVTLTELKKWFVMLEIMPFPLFEFRVGTCDEPFVEVGIPHEPHENSSLQIESANNVIPVKQLKLQFKYL